MSIRCCGLRSTKSVYFAFFTGLNRRVVEPHDYGVQNGTIKLLTYQIAGDSRGNPDWRWMETDQISDVQLLDRTFPGGRPTVSGKHHKWDKLYIPVKPADENPDDQ